MYKITLKNKKSFFCDSNKTIFEAAKENGYKKSTLTKYINGTNPNKSNLIKYN